MGRRKKAAPPSGEEGGAGGEEAGEEQPDQPLQPVKRTRREGQAEIARRRAAHFARFEEPAADGEHANVHVGANDARSLGPWSSAVELVNAREAAAQQRSAKLQQGPHRDDDGATAADPLLLAMPRQVLAEGTLRLCMPALPGRSAAAADGAAWQPARDPALGPRASCAVPRLFNLTLELLVQHIEAVASLWGVPDTIRSQLAAAVCARRALSPSTAQLFGAHQPTELVLPDCTQLDPSSMLELLQLLLTGHAQQQPEQPEAEGQPSDAGQQPDQDGRVHSAEPQQSAGGSHRLERLQLGFCGRGFGDEAAAELAAAGPLAALRVLRLGGAYKLGGDALLAVLQAAPVLQELALPSASRLTGRFLSQLPAAAPGLAVLDLQDCRGLPGDELARLISQLDGLSSLTLDGIPEVNEGVMAAAGRAPRLRSLSVAMCNAVDDAALAALAHPPGAPRASTGGDTGLAELVLDDCTTLSDAGLLALLDGAGTRNLRRLSLARCSKLTDASLVPLAERGTLERLSLNALHAVGPATLGALGRCGGGVLRELDVSHCRGITEASLGALVDRCARLAELCIYSCSQLTARFLHGHSRDDLRVLGTPTSC